MRLRLPDDDRGPDLRQLGLVSLDVATVTIGDNVNIGPGVQLLTATHPVEPARAATSGRPPSPSSSATTCGSVAAIIVCPGVTIGADTVVGAGSVVVQDLPSGVVAVGSPAKVIRTL